MMNEKKEYSPKEQNIFDLSKKIKKLGLASPTVFLLEAHLPLRSLAFNLSLISEPMLSPAFGDKFSKLKNILSSEEQIALLIQELEKNPSS